MKPDVAMHKPDPLYLRQLLALAGLTQGDAAALLGVSPRAMRTYLSTSPASHQDVPYTVQFALEAMVCTCPRGIVVVHGIACPLHSIR